MMEQTNRKQRLSKFRERNVSDDNWGTPIKYKISDGKMCHTVPTKYRNQKSSGILTKSSKQDKISQNCFVNIECLTPTKLNLVKFVNSPLLQIRNEFMNRKKKNKVQDSFEEDKNEQIHENGKCVVHPRFLTDIAVQEEGNNKDDNSQRYMEEIKATSSDGENEKNNTFTLADESDDTLTEDNAFTLNDDNNKCDKFFLRNKSNLQDSIVASPQRKKWCTRRETMFNFKCFTEDKGDNMSNNTEVEKSVDKFTTIDTRLTFDKRDLEESIKRIKQSNNLGSIGPVDQKQIFDNPLHKSPETKKSDVIEVFPLLCHSKLLDTSRNTSGYNLDKRDKHLPLNKKLAKSLQPPKSTKLLSSSRISKGSRLSFSRTPRISGSGAVGLYEFLTNENTPNQKSRNADDTDISETPPSSSSTPKVLKNHVINSLLKSTLKKKHHITFNDTINNDMNSLDNTKREKSSLVKMPNFALIHQKQFDRMENIFDYKERKSERAKQLLSGSKPSKAKSSPLKSNLKVKKELASTFNNQNYKKTTSLLENTENFEDTDQNLNRKSKKVQINVTPDNSIDIRKNSVVIRKTPFRSHTQSKSLKSSANIKDLNAHLNSEEKNDILENNMKCNNVENISSAHSKVLTSNKVNTKNFVAIASKSLATAKQSSKSSINVKKTAHTRFGFQVPVKPNKEDITKAIVNKTKVSKENLLENRRAVLKGVRLNRRFDLLMNMRKGK